MGDKLETHFIFLQKRFGPFALNQMAKGAAQQRDQFGFVWADRAL